ncbi:MAG TPA: hypothetical protein VEY94_04285 [Patescibacteria group bacterium]|nr:hypothetical protein [Patescibacteria group bacterium]
MPRLARIGALAILAAVVACAASCSSNETQAPPQATPPPDVSKMIGMQVTPAAAGACKIDAIKMCQETGGSAPAPPPSTMSYGPPNMPTSVEFQIPAGQAIKLMCYYDPQGKSVYRADATPEAALTDNSVEYMKKQGFCTN